MRYAHGVPHAALAELVRAYRRVALPPERVLLFEALLGATLGAFLGARGGTTRARFISAGVILLSGVAAGLYLFFRARFRSEAEIVRRLVGPLDPATAGRAERALSLRPHRGISEELRHLYVARAVEKLPYDAIFLRANRTARAVRVGSWAMAIAVPSFFLFFLFMIVEGADVLLARNGVAPLPMQWVTHVEMRARPPAYLHEDEMRVRPGSEDEVPNGSVISFRAEVVRPGRALFLGNGKEEIPFVDDGQGGIVARVTVLGDTRLRVFARFGEVIIPEWRETHIASRMDEAPRIAVEGAPREVSLVKESQDLTFRYEVSDDHGLREIDFVLRSGGREERRSLARLDGLSRLERGAHVLRVQDPFVKKSHAPIALTIEAKDNDAVTGPKWGKSAPIVLVVPDVGEPEAIRLDALRGVLHELVELLAFRLGKESDPRVLASTSEEKFRAFDATMVRVFSEKHAGLSVPARFRMALSRKHAALSTARALSSRTPSAASRDATTLALEKFLLVLDASIQGLALRDAKKTARALADSADELAEGFVLFRGGEKEREGAEAVTRAAVLVLGGGEKSLLRMGFLGRDLGEIVNTYLLRVSRAKGEGDYVHAELAARDLALRLREPDLSFGASGGARKGGGESGGDPGEKGGESGDDVAQAFQEAAEELSRLSQDQASEIAEVESLLEPSEEDVTAMKEELRRHAEAIRDSVRELPRVGKGSDSWTSKGSSARELAEEMARAVERGKPQDALQSGRGATSALEEAKRLAEGPRFLGGDPDAARTVDEAKRRLDGELRFAEKLASALKERASSREKQRLAERARAEEGISNRADKLLERTKERGELPEEAEHALRRAEEAARDAARALSRGDGERGSDKQKEARRRLEEARQALGDKDEGQRGDDGDKSVPSDAHVDVPDEKKHRGPEEFRRRVTRGLGGRAPDRLGDAVKRYAEGLLR